MTNKYKLLKDWHMPKRNIPAGTIYEQYPTKRSYWNSKYNHFVSCQSIKGSHGWFEEVLPVSEPAKKVSVIEVGNHKENNQEGYWYQFITNKEVFIDKFPAIKQAIEDAINGKEVEDNGHSVLMNEDIYFHNNGRSYNEWFYEFRIKKEIEQGKWNALSKIIVDFINAPLGEIITIEQYRERKYTQSEVDTIRKETWEAAREWNGRTKKDFYWFLYPNIEDYLSSLNK